MFKNYIANCLQIIARNQAENERQYLTMSFYDVTHKSKEIDDTPNEDSQAQQDKIIADFAKNINFV